MQDLGDEELRGNPSQGRNDVPSHRLLIREIRKAASRKIMAQHRPQLVQVRQVLTIVGGQQLHAVERMPDIPAPILSRRFMLLSNQRRDRFEQPNIKIRGRHCQTFAVKDYCKATML